MEKRWLGGVGLSLLLVLLVFGVGYSSGNSPTGYQFFDIFKKPKAVLPAGAEESPASGDSRCCTLTYFGLDNRGSAIVEVNGRNVHIPEGVGGRVSGCNVEFHGASSNGLNAQFTLEDVEHYTIDPVDQFSSSGCRVAAPSCCTMLFTGVNRGQALVEVNGQAVSLRSGQRRDVAGCNVELVSKVSRDGVNTIFRLQGDEITLDPGIAHSEGSCDPCNTL